RAAGSSSQPQPAPFSAWKPASPATTAGSCGAPRRHITALPRTMPLYSLTHAEGKGDMRIEVLAGNILDEPADVLISTANPWLQMTGGVNLGIIVRPQGDRVYEELQRHLRQSAAKMVSAGTIVCTGPGSLPVKKILHAVAIDPSYDSSVKLVAETIVT